MRYYRCAYYFKDVFLGPHSLGSGEALFCSIIIYYGKNSVILQLYSFGR